MPARPAGGRGPFHFSPLGNPAPLFTHLRREGDEAGLSTELHVPGPIRRAFFKADLDRHRTTPAPDFTDLYGTIDELGAPLAANPEASLFVLRDGQPVAPAQVVCARLDPWPATQPTGAVIGIDVAVGRIAVGDGFADPATVDVDLPLRLPGRHRRRPLRAAQLADRATTRRAARALRGPRRGQRAADAPSRRSPPR